MSEAEWLNKRRANIETLSFFGVEMGD